MDYVNKIRSSVGLKVEEIRDKLREVREPTVPL
jgi:hypothetical protein